MKNISVTTIMILNLLMILLSLLAAGGRAMAAAPPPQVLQGCPEKCGNVSIPYPFGVKEGCFKDPNFVITCETQNNGTQKAYLVGDNYYELLEISLSETQVIAKPGGYLFACFNAQGGLKNGYLEWRSPLGQAYMFSARRNKLIAVGCDISTFIYKYVDKNWTSGCMSLCGSQDSAINGSCSGLGCCQTSIPLGLRSFGLSIRSYFTRSRTWSPCSYAFLADQNQFTFDSSYLSAGLIKSKVPPVVLDWAIGNQTCEQAPHDACGPNSFCSNSTNGPGYRCHCKDGFEGNPYLPQVGCQDVDECEMGRNNSCYRSAICNNTEGSYNCSCPRGYFGDGWVNGTRCTKIPNAASPILKIVAGIGVGCLILPAFIWFLYLAIKKRRLIKQREKFFQQNGGMLLELAYKGVEDNIAKIFTIEELNKATNNFSQKLGEGGYGAVFKGILSSGKVVAIKKSKTMDKRQGIPFINEVYILFRINHRHVVKLLGCCLETEVPLLVYEFVSNGTLYQHIHNKNQAASLSWEDRLRISAETADALSYLHSSHSVPIFHRDIKLANILLDDKYKAKVSDFGASRLVPLDQTLQTTKIQGTCGYIDPECQTGELTDKSDVYSFGVVLAELLTGKKALLSEGTKECTTLAKYFVSSIKDGNLFGILDDRIKNNGKKEQLQEVAELVRNCLEDKRDDRPTMKEVSMMLDSLMKEVSKKIDSLKMLHEQSSLQHNQVTENSPGGPSTSSSSAALETEVFYSITDDDLCKDDKVRGKTCWSFKHSKSYSKLN